MNRRVFARIGLALALMLGALVVASLDADTGAGTRGPATIARSSSSTRPVALAVESPVSDAVAIASARGADDSRSAQGRLFSATLGGVVALAALAAWGWGRSASEVPAATRATMRARRRAPPHLRSA